MSQGIIMGWAIVWLFVSVAFYSWYTLSSILEC